MTENEYIKGLATKIATKSGAAFAKDVENLLIQEEENLRNNRWTNEGIRRLWESLGIAIKEQYHGVTDANAQTAMTILDGRKAVLKG